MLVEPLLSPRLAQGEEILDRLKLLALSLGWVLVAFLMISCRPAAEPLSPTAAAPVAPAPAPTPSPAAQLPAIKSQVPRLSATELKDRLDQGEPVLVVDVRAASLFESRHIAGAISVPVNQVEARLAEFPRDQDIVFY
jgi:hypothetical protein